MVTLHASMAAVTTTASTNHTQSLVRVTAIPNLRIRSAISIPRIPNGKVLKERVLNMSSVSNTLFNKNTRVTPLLEKVTPIKVEEIIDQEIVSTLNTTKIYILLETVIDRIEMHNNIGEQRNNWNSLLLNSLNMITLTATTMAALASVEAGSDVISPSLKVASVFLFTAAMGITLIMNKIQPSQLVEEQRNAVRLFKQLKTQIQTTLALGAPTEDDMQDAMERVLAADKAYPLPLLNGAMIEKFPETFEPATWWPTASKKAQSPRQQGGVGDVKNNNGWSEELEEEMREVVGVIERKDKEDYYNLGNKALKISKMLAKAGPLLMGTAAVGSAFVGHGGAWGGVVAAVAGSLGSVVNTVEHGGQVGMVLEMYRNCAGFFSLLEEKVECTLEEKDLGRRENGELFEMKMALHLGRSLSDLRDLAHKSRTNGGCVDEFASKLF